MLLGLFPVTAFAASHNLMSSSGIATHLESGQTLNDDLFILGGTVNLMSGSTINGSVFIIGGSVQAAGTVNGDVHRPGWNRKSGSDIYPEWKSYQRWYGGQS